MSAIENDLRKLRLIYQMSINASKVEFETETGKEAGKGINEAIKILKPYFVELAEKLKCSEDATKTQETKK